MTRLRHAVLHFARHERDDDELALQKVTILLVALSCSACGCVWAAMYAAVFGLGLTMALPLVFVVIVGAAIPLSAYLRDHRPLVYAQLACITFISACIEWSIGGIGDAGLVICWSFLGPIGALMFLPLRGSIPWMGAFLAILAVTIGFEDILAARAQPVSPAVRRLFFAMNVGAPATVVFAAAAWFVHKTQQERRKSEALLRNILPDPIARRLKDGSSVIADWHGSVSVLFADIVGFTSYSAQVGPEELVSRLDAIFQRFDVATSRRGLEKIKTIGDAYMVAAGVPEGRVDHAHALADLALDLRAIVADGDGTTAPPFEVRIGVHSGPVVAGVIGSTKFAYDLWGDTVNTASRMESHGEGGCIQISADTAELLGSDFLLEDRGVADIKGKGPMRVFRLLGRASR